MSQSREHDLERNRAIATGLLAAIASGDLDRIGALLHPEAEWWVQGHGTLPRDQFLESLAGTIERAATRVLDVHSVTAQDDRVAVEASGRFAFAEGDYCNSYVYLFRIADGLIVHGCEYLDTQVAARFFGRAA